jgi:hypothetical protein
MFAEQTSKNSSEAAQILIREAVLAAPSITEKEVRLEFKDMQRAWASRKLYSGDANQMEKLVRVNMEEIASQQGFKEFFIYVIEDQKCAQANASFKSSFIGIRVWRTNTKLFVCGNSGFHDVLRGRTESHEAEKTALLAYWKFKAKELLSQGGVSRDFICDSCNSSLSRNKCYYVASWMRCPNCTKEVLQRWANENYTPDYFGAGEVSAALAFYSSKKPWWKLW